MAQEKIFHLRALGAEIYITRSDVGKGHPDYYQDLAERLAREQGGFYVNQFANPANPDAHERTTGPEILEQMGGDLDAVVVGVGSGGTLTGIGRFMKRAAPKVKMILADPKGSVLAPLIKTGTMPKPGSWVVEGIGEDFVPPNCDLSLVAEALTVTDGEALTTARELLLKEGVLGGSSTGTLLAGALRWCRAQTSPKRVVTLVCDSGNKYLSKMFNDYWMIDQGFIQRERTGDLRDLITRRHSERATVTVAPEDTLMTAYARMKLYDVSQLPVLQKGEVVGIIDESDLLLAVYDNEAAFREPVRSAMTARLETVDSSASLESLLPIFAQGHVVIVKHEGAFAGLITRIDLINHLRRRLK
jgi:cystathionine beta-synthase